MPKPEEIQRLPNYLLVLYSGKQPEYILDNVEFFYAKTMDDLYLYSGLEFQGILFADNVADKDLIRYATSLVRFYIGE